MGGADRDFRPPQATSASALQQPRNTASSLHDALGAVLSRLRPLRERLEVVASRTAGNPPSGEKKSELRPSTIGIFAVAIDRCDDMQEELTYLEQAVSLLENTNS